MKEVEIDLSQPFEKILEAVLALPNRSATGDSENGTGEKELRLMIRALYEAANGRQVETPLGLIPIAPPIAPFLKARPLRAATLREILVAAAPHIVSPPLHGNGRSSGSPTSNRHRETKSQGQPAIGKPPVRARSHSQSSPAGGPDFLTPPITAAHYD